MEFAQGPLPSSIAGAVYTLAATWTSIALQSDGKKWGSLLIAIPCGLVSLKGLATAYREGDGVSLIGSAFAGAGAVVSAAGYYTDDDTAKKIELVIPTSIGGTALGLIGALLIEPMAVVQVANPFVAPAVAVGLVNGNAAAVVINPLRG